MESLVEMIMQGSTTLDAPVIVRLVILCLLIEFIGIIFSTIGRMGK